MSEEAEQYSDTGPPSEVDEASPEPFQNTPAEQVDGAQEETPETSLRSLRTSWEFPSLVCFARLFSEQLKLKPFSADQLERALLSPNDNSVFLSEFCYKLLRRDANAAYNEDDSHDWERLLGRKVSSLWRDWFPRNPLGSHTTFNGLSPLVRARVLYAVCERRIHDCPVLKDTIKWTVENSEFTAEALRHYPIGEDAAGSRYYFFSANNEDCRLYREDPPKHCLEDGDLVNIFDDGEAAWDTPCVTLEDMQSFCQRMVESSYKKEKTLGDILQDQIIPKLVATVDARRKAEERAAVYEAAPKKRSDRVLMMAQKREMEEKAKREREEELRRLAEEKAKERERRRKEKELMEKQREEMLQQAEQGTFAQHMQHMQPRFQHMPQPGPPPLLLMSQHQQQHPHIRMAQNQLPPQLPSQLHAPQLQHHLHFPSMGPSMGQQPVLMRSMAQHHIIAPQSHFQSPIANDRMLTINRAAPLSRPSTSRRNTSSRRRRRDSSESDTEATTSEESEEEEEEEISLADSSSEDEKDVETARIPVVTTRAAKRRATEPAPPRNPHVRINHFPGWSPLGVHVPRAKRTSSYQPQEDYEMMVECAYGNMPDFDQHKWRQSRQAAQAEERSRRAARRSEEEQQQQQQLNNGSNGMQMQKSLMHGANQPADALLQRQRLLQQIAQQNNGQPLLNPAALQQRQQLQRADGGSSILLPGLAARNGPLLQSSTFGGQQMLQQQQQQQQPQQQPQQPQQPTQPQFSRLQIQQVLASLSPEQQNTLMQMPPQNRQLAVLQLMQMHQQRAAAASAGPGGMAGAAGLLQKSQIPGSVQQQQQQQQLQAIKAAKQQRIDDMQQQQQQQHLSLQQRLNSGASASSNNPGHYPGQVQVQHGAYGSQGQQFSNRMHQGPYTNGSLQLSGGINQPPGLLNHLGSMAVGSGGGQHQVGYGGSGGASSALGGMSFHGSGGGGSGGGGNSLLSMHGPGSGSYDGARPSNDGSGLDGSLLIHQSLAGHMPSGGHQMGVLNAGGSGGMYGDTTMNSIRSLAPQQQQQQPQQQHGGGSQGGGLHTFSPSISPNIYSGQQPQQQQQQQQQSPVLISSGMLGGLGAQGGAMNPFSAAGTNTQLNQLNRQPYSFNT